MKPDNPEYSTLLNTVVTELRKVVKDAYKPYLENVELKDVINYELHVVCSFLMNFLIKISDTGAKSDGTHMTVLDAWEEFSRIMGTSIHDYMEFCEKTDMTEH